MDENNFPQCSNVQKAGQVEVKEENEKVKPIKKPSNILSSDTQNICHNSNPTRIQGRPLIIQASPITPISTQPRFYSNLPSQQSMLELNCPLPLFFQALSKLNEKSLNIAGLTQNNAKFGNYDDGDLTPPDSLGNAPPSYSFVLRQMAARRRPRLMGTFIPSPSFVQHTPPPNYATAFDIYVDPVAPPAPTRVYHFGFTSTPFVCPECGFAGMTVIRSRVTMCTHMCAFLLCLFCCWICAPLPYVLKSCKDVYHHCRNCRNFLGMYSPTNPDSAYMNA